MSTSKDGMLSVEKAIGDARQALDRALAVIDHEVARLDHKVEAALLRLGQAQAEYDAQHSSALAGKQVIERHLRALQ